MKEPSVSKSIRIPISLWQKINELIDENNIPDFSSAARSLIEAGLWLNENKKDLTDSEKSKKLIDEYNSKLDEKLLFDWVRQLSFNQIDGLNIALQLEKEKRITNNIIK